MAFPTGLTQAEGLIGAKNQARWVKGEAQNAVALLGGSVTSNQVFQMIDNLRSWVAYFNQVAAIPGIAAYAQAQYDNTGLDIVAEFTTMVNNIQACVDWVVANFPSDAGGFIEAYKLNADGSRTPATFTSAQTAGLTTALNNLIASIQ